MIKVTDATKQDARHLAYLVNLAGEGMPFHMWHTMCAPGQQVIDLGTERAARETGDFSYKNARILKEDNEITSCLIAFPLDDPYNLSNLETYPDYIKPLVQLEAMAAGNWYINVLAVYEPYRHKGYARMLMQESFMRARKAGHNSVCLIVHSANTPALTLYESLGFDKSAELPAIVIPGIIESGNWQLLVKQL